MKYSGIAVALIGICILLFSIVAGTGTWQSGPSNNETARGSMNLVIPIVMGVFAMIIGGVMYLYGGRGFIKTRNPSVRN
jgi:hypothetical protein